MARAKPRPDPSGLAGLLASRESRNIEFKSRLHDLAQNNGRGEFVKDVLALANTTSPETDSTLVIGVEDARGGGRIVGIDSPLDGDQLAQIIAEYSDPVPDIRVENAKHKAKTLGVIRVKWTELFPYFVRRDLGGVVRAGEAYTRRDGIVGKLTPAEIEYLLRAKAARLGPALIQEPLLCGFINYGHFHGPHGPILRIANISDTPIQDVRVVFDISWRLNPTVFRRQPSFEGPLNPGESRELELHLSTIHLDTPDRKGVGMTSDHPKWLDVLARIEYRNRHGLIAEIQARSMVMD